MEKLGRTMRSTELLLSFEKVLVSSGILINSVEKHKEGLKNFYLVRVIFKNEQMNLYVNLSNIGSAYLPNKPYILRRQVGKLIFNDLPVNKNTSLTLLIGITYVNDEIVVACWNPFYFVGHSTNRSCYILESSIEKANCAGLYVGDDCKTPVFVCSSSHFSELLDVYIERNLVD